MPVLPAVDVEAVDRARGSGRRFLVAVCLGAAVVRATYVARPLRNDEGGYLLVARHWRTGGEFLYGDWFVDRPPVLMAIFRIAALTEWDQAVRLLAIPFVLVSVVAGWRAGRLLGGRPGGRWAAVLAAGMLCSPGLAAEQADGELFGAAFVLVSLACALSAWHADDARHRRAWAAAAGVAAACAPLVKQNLLEGALFLCGLVLLARWGGDGQAWRRVRSLGRAALGGALLPVALSGLWLLVAQVDPALVWRDLVGFRGAAFDAIWSSSPDATIRRAWQLAVLGLVTGLFPVVATWFAARRDRRSPEHGAITLLLLFGVAAIAAGGSFWPPYLLQLGPAAVLAAGVLAPRAGAAGSWMRGCAGWVAGAAVVGAVASAVVHTTVPSLWGSQRTGEWLAASKEPADTAVVAYGLPSVLEAADTATPYPYLWSVPMRTSDPRQERLRATLAGPAAPEWIVQVAGLDAWGIDDGALLRDLVHQRYRVVATVCGHRVWLRQDVTRVLAAAPRC